ncbi:hypothetical protein BC941DRAFT_187635, partial [Chlamydoabsidia padenii]
LVLGLDVIYRDHHAVSNIFNLFPLYFIIIIIYNMYSRLPMRFNATAKSGLSRRFYATHHQEQDPKSGSSVPLIIAGLIGVGGLVYYSNKGGKKALDPSDKTGQKVQKEADKAISERTDAQGNVYPEDAPPSTVINEKVDQTSHPVATKAAAYVDPKKHN